MVQFHLQQTAPTRAARKIMKAVMEELKKDGFTSPSHSPVDALLWAHPLK
jgi:hypothetical protein